MSHIHLIGICGTGMSALAGLLSKLGHRITGSDRAFDPPIGPLLESLGIETMAGWDARNLDAEPDLVVIGNVCRPDNPEAKAAIERSLTYTSLPGALDRFFLSSRPATVVAGTHGKTTTTSIVASLLHQLGNDPGLFVGGVPLDFGRGFRVGGEQSPFVLEGDEYDSAFFEKSPKFWQYRPQHAIVTSIEYDHIDIYGSVDEYLDAFRRFVALIPTDGLLVAYAGDAHVRDVAGSAQCPVIYYAVDGDDCGDVSPTWLGALAPSTEFFTPIDLYGGGTYLGRAHSPLMGTHNARNAIAALAIATQAHGANLSDAMTALSNFKGVRRRQEHVAKVRGVDVFDDFAHHPTAVQETIAAFRHRFASRRIVVVFEPRSATASRRLHQDSYPDALRGADVSHLAPVARTEVPDEEQLDTDAIAASVRDAGGHSFAHASAESILRQLETETQDGDCIIIMSNGRFGDFPDRLVAKLATAKR